MILKISKVCFLHRWLETRVFKLKHILWGQGESPVFRYDYSCSKCGNTKTELSVIASFSLLGEYPKTHKLWEKVR